MQSTQLFASDWDFLHKWWFILLAINAIAGIALLERAWAQTSRFRNPNMEVEELMPAFRRLDALQWQKWKLYPGAMTLLIPRFLFAVTLMCAQLVGIRIILAGANMEKPLSAARKSMIDCLYYIVWRMIGVLTFFTWHTYEYLDEVDYSEYLGVDDAQTAFSAIGELKRERYSVPYEISSRLLEK
jgi:hypothetical protein